jgi:hypothetical protein
MSSSHCQQVRCQCLEAVVPWCTHIPLSARPGLTAAATCAPCLTFLSTHHRLWQDAHWCPHHSQQAGHPESSTAGCRAAGTHQPPGGTGAHCRRTRHSLCAFQTQHLDYTYCRFLLAVAQHHMVLQVLRVPDSQGQVQQPLKSAAFHGDTGSQSIGTWDADRCVLCDVDSRRCLVYTVCASLCVEQPKTRSRPPYCSDTLHHCAVLCCAMPCAPLHQVEEGGGGSGCGGDDTRAAAALPRTRRTQGGCLLAYWLAWADPCSRGSVRLGDRAAAALVPVHTCLTCSACCWFTPIDTNAAVANWPHCV